MVMDALLLLSLFPRLAPFFPPQRLVKLDDPRVLAAPAVIQADKKRAPWFGEKLQYNVKWGIVVLGTAYMDSTEAVDFDGRPAFRAKTEAVSNGFADAFYKVRDRYESFIDAGSLASLGFAKKIREGDFYRDEWALYDSKGGTFFAKSRDKKGEETLYEGTIPPDIQDMLSSLYYIRSKELEIGREYTLDVNTKRNWPLVVKVLGRETVRVPAGKFDCWLVEPFLRDEGLFIQKGKRLEVWLSADERRMPVQMHVEIFLGHIRAELEKIGAP